MSQTLSRSSTWFGVVVGTLLCLSAAPLRAQAPATPLVRAEAAGAHGFDVSPEAGLLGYIVRNSRGKPEWYLVTVSLKTGKPTKPLTFPNPVVRSIAFSKDGKTLFWANDDGKIVRRDVATGKEESVRYREPITTVEQTVVSFILAPNGKTAALTRASGGTDFVDLEAGRIIPGEPLAASYVIFSPDAKIAYVENANRKGHIEVYDVATKKRLRTLQPGFGQPERCTLSPDGSTLAITEPKLGPDLLRNHIVLWDPVTDKEMARFRLGPPPPEGFNPLGLATLAYSPDGKTIAVWDGFPLLEKADPAIRFVDAANGEHLGAIHVHDRPPKLAFSPDGKAILSLFANRANQTFVDVYSVPVLKAPPKSNTNPGDLIVKGSEWVSKSPSQVLTILERNGEAFKARFIHNAFDRDISGTIKDGKISWLAKDVRATKGDTGGDTLGTIQRDGTIDFVDAAGKAMFTLKLKKDP